jgi:hypothetical protein
LRPGALEYRSQTAGLFVHERPYSREGKIRELGQRLDKHLDIARENCAQHQSGGELATFAQMTDQWPDLAFGRLCRKRNRCFLARILDDTLGAIGIEPFAGDDKACKRLGELRDQGLPCRVAAETSSRRSIVSRTAAR